MSSLKINKIAFLTTFFSKILRPGISNQNSHYLLSVDPFQLSFLWSKNENPFSQPLQSDESQIILVRLNV